MSLAITSTPFGHLRDGRAASLFWLRNDSGASVCFTDFGAALVRANMPDSAGRPGPVALGFDTLMAYENNHAYIGPVIGPVSNRISGAQFNLGGKAYTLDANEGNSCLHSGSQGWHNKLWTSEITERGLRFYYKTQDGDGGFPGQVSAQIDINLDDNNRLIYTLQARTTAPTPIALTRHEYFNLTDGGATPIDDHLVQIISSSYAELDEDNTATGEVALLSKKTQQLRTLTPISAFKNDKGELPFDYHYIVQGDGLRHMARVQSPASGRQLDVFATTDGLQFYTGQAMKPCKGASGRRYGPSHGFAMEPQARPNAVNHAHFPSIILQPDNTYQETIVYAFGLID